MKFDITKRIAAVDRLIEETTDVRHRTILENYRRHAHLEVCGMWPEIFDPRLTVEEPIYRFHGPTGIEVLEGAAKVKAMYQDIVDTQSTVMFHTEEHIAVCDAGFLTEYVNNRFWPGEVLARRGDKIDDPGSWYLVTMNQMMFWPYDERCRMKEERVYRGANRAIRKCADEEVVTVQEAREKLLPTLKPIEEFLPAEAELRLAAI